MSKVKRRDGPQEALACPACKGALDTVIKRHKTLGIFVPVWSPGPCRNPDCPEYREETERKRLG
ncbi:hypothetical protein [Streptomyces cucumeris]|uniref:hypothetical protein n=1 Tax=Streptomyces cucumeris TaxID=2962890 RepID=UPI003D75D33A